MTIPSIQNYKIATSKLSVNLSLTFRIKWEN